MNPQDKSFLTMFVGVITGLVLLAVGIFLISRGVSLLALSPEDNIRRLLAAEERIKPIGRVALAEPTEEGPAQAQRSGEEVTAQVCASCHTPGTLGAPKIGSKEDWDPRFAQGLDTLVEHAIAGMGAMPPKGGDPSLSEEEIRESVAYMLAESDIDVEAAPAEAEATEGPAAPEAAPSFDLANGEQIYTANCAACHDTGVAGAPKKGDKDVWEPRFEQGLDTLVAHAIDGIGAMPAKGGNPGLSDDDVRNSVAFMLTETGFEIEAAPAAEAAPEVAAPTAEAAPQREAMSMEQEAMSVAREATSAANKAASAAEAAASAAREAAAAANKALSLIPQPAQEPPQKETLPAAPAPAPAEEAAPEAAPEPSKEEAEPAERLMGPQAPGSMLQQPVPSVPSQESAPPAQPAPEEVVPSPEKEQEAPATEAERAVPKPREEEAEPAERLMGPQAPGSMLQQPVPSVPSQESAPPAQPAPEEVVPSPEGKEEASPPTMESTGIILPPDLDLAHGRQLYNSACVICHGTGAAGAPKLGDEAAWAPRLAQGFDVLVDHSLNGYKAMPPKGGRMDLPDEEIISAVGYMVSEAQQ